MIPSLYIMKTKKLINNFSIFCIYLQVFIMPCIVVLYFIVESGKTLILYLNIRRAILWITSF